MTGVQTCALPIFSIDTLNLSQKVYNLLNRIAVSGGTYKDWIETVYTTDYYSEQKRQYMKVDYQEKLNSER